MKLALVPYLLLAGLGPSPLYPQTGDPANDVRRQLIGTWAAVSIEDHMSDGRPHTPSFGSRPVGFLTYDAAGRMTAQLMNPERAKVALGAASAEQVKAALAGFLAYSGTYTVDPARGVILHHVDCALDPADLGTDKVRRYVLEGDRLTLTVSPYNDNGTMVESRTLVWRRLRMEIK